MWLKEDPRSPKGESGQQPAYSPNAAVAQPKSASFLAVTSSQTKRISPQPLTIDMTLSNDATASPLGPASSSIVETPEKLSPSEHELTPHCFDLGPFAVGEDFIPEAFKPFIIDDVEALSGRWTEIKHLTTPLEPVLARLGVGALRRRAVAAAKLECELEVLSIDEQGKPVMRLKAHYPMGVTKESIFPTDASPTLFADPDTCEWTSSAMWCGGRLIHVRRGAKGTLLDCRAALSRHPDLQATEESPLLMLSWFFVDPFGDRLGGQQFYARASVDDLSEDE